LVSDSIKGSPEAERREKPAKFVQERDISGMVSRVQKSRFGERCIGLGRGGEVGLIN